MTDKFWVGGTGNWSDDTNHWSLSSGGAPGGGNLPTSSDNAIFDAASNATAYTVTMDSGTISCLDLNFSAAPSGSGTITWAGTFPCTISGSLTALTGMTITYTSTTTFNSTSTGKTVDTKNINLLGGLIFNGVGGGWTFSDNVHLPNGSGAIAITNGTLDTNGKTVSVNGFTINTAGTATFGASTINVTNVFTVNGSGVVNAGTSTVALVAGASSFSGAGRTYNDITLDLSATSPTVNGANIFNNFSVAASGNSFLAFSADQTINGTLTFTGSTNILRPLVVSSTIGTARTLSVATMAAMSDINFRDITITGAASPISGTRIGDLKGNSGITFTGAADKFWVGNTANINAANVWATSSGGAGATNNYPLPQDSLVFDAGSFSADAQTCTFNVASFFTGLNTTAIDQAVTLTFTGAPTIQGNVVLGGTLTLGGGGQWLFTGRTSQSLTTAGITLSSTINVNSFGGSLVLQDNLIMPSAKGILLTVGTFDLNNKNVTTGVFSQSGANSPTLTLGSGTIEIQAADGNPVAAQPWIAGATLVVTATTGTIKLTDATATTKTFVGAGKTYGNIWLSGVGIGTFDFTGSNTFTDFKADIPPHTIRFTAGTTTTVGTFSVDGKSGSPVTLSGVTNATWTITKSGGGVIDRQFLDIRDSTATPSDTWKALLSNDRTNNSGWKFHQDRINYEKFPRRVPDFRRGAPPS